MSRSNQQPEQKRVLRDRNKPIGFGKFAHERLQDVLDNDPQYLLWLDANTDIDIASDVLTEAQEALQPNHYFSGYTDRERT